MFNGTAERIDGGFKVKGNIGAGDFTFSWMGFLLIRRIHIPIDLRTICQLIPLSQFPPM